MSNNGKRETIDVNRNVKKQEYCQLCNWNTTSKHIIKTMCPTTVFWDCVEYEIIQCWYKGVFKKNVNGNVDFDEKYWVARLIMKL